MKPLPGPTWSVSPTQWGARVDYDQWADRHVAKDAIAIHHGGSGDYAAAKTPYSVDKEASQLRAWERYHLGRGWRGLAYGYAVGMTGTVYRIRGWNGYGAHRGDIDGDGISNNKEIVPVIFIMSGQPHRHHPSPEMHVGFEALRAYLEDEADTGLYLYGHRELMATACPGDNNMPYIRTHRHSGDVPPPPPTPTPPPPVEEDIEMALLPIRYGDGYQNPPDDVPVAGDRTFKQEDVKIVQDLVGFTGRNLDGRYGPATARAISDKIYNPDTDPVTYVGQEVFKALGGYATSGSQGPPGKDGKDGKDGLDAPVPVAFTPVYFTPDVP